MTAGMSGSRVTVLPVCSPNPLYPILFRPGKAGLTWGGRYWVRTSDLFGVKQVSPIVYAGQTANPLVGSGQERRRAARDTP